MKPEAGPTTRAKDSPGTCLNKTKAICKKTQAKAGATTTCQLNKTSNAKNSSRPISTKWNKLKKVYMGPNRKFNLKILLSWMRIKGRARVRSKVNKSYSKKGVIYRRSLRMGVRMRRMIFWGSGKRYWNLHRRINSRRA